jgi:PAS domain S-box-containing protein
MTTALRVLLVEDDEADALLTLRELRKGGFEPEWKRVETRAGMDQALAAGAWDLVICDHLMPSFSSAGALDVMRSHALDLPFIIVSGAAPEDLITAAMRQGAHDFISKGNLMRLVPAVRRELKEAALRRDRQRMQSRLVESEARTELLAAAVAQVTEAIALTDPEGVVSYVNRSFEALVGSPVRQIKGRALSDLLGHPVMDRAACQAASGSVWEGRLSLPREGAPSQEFDATCSPVRDAGGAVRHLVAVIRDVTKEVELERELRQAQKMDALGLLAAGLAHDFNNLLTTILASAELLKCRIDEDSPLLPRVDAIIHAGLCGAGLTRQILGLSRKTDEKRVPLDFTTVVREALATLHGSIPANVRMHDDLMSGLWVEGDPALLQQLVLNLGINAIQAMQSGGGSLWVALSEEEEARGQGGGRWALLTVRDSGCGMDPQVLERIFEPFFTTKPVGEGTGLGLAMVHTTVTKAGGRISVQSAPGLGTTFEVRLPCATGAAAGLYGSESILLVDDDEVVTAIISQGLHDLGYRVCGCTSARGALERFGRDPGSFDLALLDPDMPDMNGFELAGRLQELRPDLPLVLVTGGAAAGTLPADARTTFQDILAKPFSAQDLASIVRKAMLARGGGGPRPAMGLPAIAAGPRPSVLLAEDNRTARSMMGKYLKEAGYEVQEAEDGLQAWKLFNRAAHGGRFDLLLTDVVMPRMDGLELVQLVRKADPAIPIGVVTSNEDKETVKAALKLGVDEFLNKPFGAADLMASVQRMLEKRRTLLDARRSQETAQAVRSAQRTLVAVPEQGVPLFTLYEPLTDAGGDVLRCFRCADGSILFVLADVAGHSVLSSYAVASFLGMLSSFVGECMGLMTLASSCDGGDGELPCVYQQCGRYGLQPCDPLADLARKLNHAIQSGPFSEVPVCALLGLWAPSTGRLELMNAGMPHGLRCRPGGETAGPIELNGTPLGVFAEPDLERAIVWLEPGDRCLFGTDGFFEVASRTGATFQETAPALWQAMADTQLDRALSLVCEAARSHGGGVITDDLLVVGFEQPALARSNGEFTLQIPSTTRAVDLACDRFQGWLEGSAGAGRASAARRFDISLAVREALTNAVIHGNGKRPEAQVALYGRPLPEPRGVEVTVVDQGPGFDLEAYRPPTDPISDRGRGIPLIHHHARDVRMTGNTLTMTFLFEEPAHDQR